MLNRARPRLDYDKIIPEIADPSNIGPDQVSFFEEEFRKKIGSRRCIAVNQGRSSLFMILKLLDIVEGDEVIVQSFICQVVIDAILEVGAIPVLADVNEYDYNISTEDITRLLSPRTKAVIVTHMFGNSCGLHPIMKIAMERGIYVIEDCAHSFGSKYRDKVLGSIGDISFFSFNFDKPFSTGDGGMICINNDRIMEKWEIYQHEHVKTDMDLDRNIIYGLIIQHVLTDKGYYKGYQPLNIGKRAVQDFAVVKRMSIMISEYGSPDKFKAGVHDLIKTHPIMMENRRSILDIFPNKIRNIKRKIMIEPTPRVEKKDLLMNGFRSLTALISMGWMDEVAGVRNRNTSLYRELLGDIDSYGLPIEGPHSETDYLRFSILNHSGNETVEIRKYAQKHGYEIGNFNWGQPIHMIDPYRKILKFNNTRLKNSENVSKKIINLPVHYYVDDEDVENIVRILEIFSR